MTEHEATPEQQADVRRLLAGARHDEPLPPEVAARLDDVLVALVAEGPGSIDPPPPPPTTPVIDLAARRRRRAGGLLLAAAAVVVAGVGLGQVVGTAGGQGDDASSAVADAESGAARDAGAKLDEDQALAPTGVPSAGDAAPTVPETASGAGDPNSEPGSRVPRLTTSTFADRAAQLQRRPGYLVSDENALVSGLELAQDPMYVCENAGFGAGNLLGVFYNGQPAVLAFRPPMGETQTADLLQCGSAQLLRSITLPALAP